MRSYPSVHIPIVIWRLQAHRAVSLAQFSRRRHKRTISLLLGRKINLLRVLIGWACARRGAHNVVGLSWAKGKDREEMPSYHGVAILVQIDHEKVVGPQHD